ncbi:MAG: acetyl-CoA acetyltransferase [Actinobacteria bacterium]|nr:acetyl-CoA acetyltransferase [Actinomycetota bacterium]
MSVDPRTPCIIGVAQQTWRDAELAPEPLDMWEEVSAAAAGDAGLTDLAALDSVQVVYTQSWQYDDPAGRLCERLGATPAHRFYSGIGGTTPQVLVNKTCESLLAGEYDLALITGAEALATRRKLRKTGEKPDWSYRHPESPPFPFEDPFHPAEMAHQVWEAWLTFPIWDIARRAKLGVAPEAYRRQQGELLAPMTEVAAANPYAWFPQVRSVDELITATSNNRMVGYPYTKYMVSIMDVDMAAALVLTTHETANDLGVPDDKRVYVRGWCYATDPPYVAEHVDMTRSPAMEAASREALTRAGVGVDDVAHFDLYSCFASSVNFAIDALGVRADDPRGPFTVTGGLPFAGGAGSDYVTHSIASMVDTLRADPGAIGLVSGVGMHMQKHAFGVYSTTPGDVRPPGPVPAAERETIVDTYTGSVTVASYTAAHGRDGEAEWGLVIGDVPGGGRTYGRVEDPGMLAAMEAEEWVGRSVELKTGEGNVNLVVG